MDSSSADLLQLFKKATEEFELCPNRVWAAAKEKLPELMPEEFEPIKDQLQHEQCTFDFCEHSQRDFTAVKQRHECGNGKCDRLRYLFSRDTLEEAAAHGKSTVWHVEGTSTVEPPTPYMAISHVWSDGTGIGAWPDGQVNECLYTFFRDMAAQFQCEGIWWDTLCIPKGKEARNRAIQNIPNNYQDARITLVHDYFLRNCKWDEKTSCFAILMSPWFSRGWTAVELAKSRKVKVIFQGPCGPLTKDLDEEILAKDNEPHGPRKAASDIIRNLRKGITKLDHLLAVLGPRHTSWPKDMATISALLAGVTPRELQQETYKGILKKMGKISPSHLFHNAATLPTISWCPTSLLNMRTAGTDHSLRIEANWDTTGLWKVIPVVGSLKENCVWNGSHALIKRKALEALASPTKCRLLVEPNVSAANRALLVEVEEVLETELRCHYVGPLYFHPWMLEKYVGDMKQNPDEEQKPVKVRLLREARSGHGGPSHHISGSEERDTEGDIAADADVSENSRFLLAASGGDDNAIKELLHRSPMLINSTDTESKRTALHYAIWRGHVRVAKVLIKKAASIQAKDNRGQTPLHLAAERGDEMIVSSLLETILDTSHDAAAVLSATCSEGQTALHRAAWGGSRKVVQQLLRSRVDAGDRAGNTALHIAADKGFGPVVMTLLELNANVDPTNQTGMTPLHYAAVHGHETVVECLIENKAKVMPKNKFGWTPLHLAAMNGYEAVVNLLSKTIADVDVQATDDKVGWTPLHLAAMYGHEAVVMQLLAKVADRNLVQVDKFGWTLRRFAAMNGHEAVVELLPQDDADDNLEKNVHWTSMHLAAMNGPKTVVRLLLEQNADVKLTDGEGRTLLHGAAERGYETTVKLLLEKDAEVNAEDRESGRTALSWAAGNGHQAIVQLLTRERASVDVQDNSGWTPLWWAASKGDQAMVQLLLDKGAAIDTKDTKKQTPLLWAARTGDRDLAQLLLTKGADRDAKDKNYRTPLSWAAGNGHQAIIQLLTQKGAVVSVKDKHGQTPLSWATANGHEAAVHLLLNKDVNVDKDKSGRTLLSYAAGNGHQHLVLLLLKKRADVDAKDWDERTPLSWAAENGHQTVVQLLLEGDASINTKDRDKRTPLSWATENGHQHLVQLLLDEGADVDVKDWEERTPLLWAAKNGHQTIVRLLLKGGADINTKDRDERTPLSWAAGNGHPAVVELLLLNRLVDVSIRDRKDQTALSWAVRNGHQAIIELFDNYNN